MVSGAGMLLLWPRYLVRAMFVTILFAYTLLASAEERECLARSGDAYGGYLRRTHRFVPVALPWVDRLPSLPTSRWRRAAAVLVLYVVSLGVGLGLAAGAQRVALRRLQTVVTDEAVYLSLVRMEPAAMERVIEVARANPQAQEWLAAARGRPGARFLNYALPADLFISEIPMHGASSRQSASRTPATPTLPHGR